MSNGENEGDFQGEIADAYDKNPFLESLATLIYTRLQGMPGWSPEGQRILDYGCGTCQHAIPMAKDGAQVLGIDVSERMIELSREKVKDRQLQDKIKLLHVQGASEVLEKEGPFDAATVVYVLHHAYKHLDEILETLHKVLKQHGKVFVQELSPTERSKITREKTVKLRQEHMAKTSHGHHHEPHCHDWVPADELEARAKKHGFTVDNSEPYVAVNAFGEGLTLDCYTMVLSRQD